MMLSESVVEENRLRLPNRSERVATTTGLGRVGGFLFGLVFVAIGAFIVLIGLRVIPADPSSVNAPYWVVTLCGVIFATFGAIIWGMVRQERRLIQRRRTLAERHPYSTVFADYPWNPMGVAKSPWGPAWKAFGIALFLAVFLAPFNWWAWGSEDGVLMVKIIVILFDLILLLTVFELVRRILIGLKYGRSRLEYATFPALTGSRVDLRWFPPAGLENATKIVFVLRCVEEWIEASGSGDNRTTQLIHEQLWAATRATEGPVNCRPDYPIDLSFDLSATAPGSNLAGELKITFWELDVSAEAPGVDFQERYLVPVYPSTT